MSITSHSVRLTAILVSASVLLAACSGDPGQSDQLQSSEQSLGTLGSPLASASPRTQPVQPKMEMSMKELSEFEQIAATQATITTTKGDITIELYREGAPLTTANFLNLAKSGFYDGIVFHRVIPDFMAQVGDPLTKDETKKPMWGTGGPEYRIADEFGPNLTHDSEGIVSMANSGPNTGGSQFFITYGPQPHLDGRHAVFGKVTKGMDVLQQITVGDKIVKISYQ